MDSENTITSSSLSSYILKEIELLPSEFKEKSEEVRLLQKHLHELDSKYNKKKAKQKNYQKIQLKQKII